jgi:hypothetical protein
MSIFLEIAEEMVFQLNELSTQAYQSGLQAISGIRQTSKSVTGPKSPQLLVPGFLVELILKLIPASDSYMHMLRYPGISARWRLRTELP